MQNIQYKQYIHIHAIQAYSCNTDNTYNTLQYIQYTHIHTFVCMYMYGYVSCCIDCIVYVYAFICMYMLISTCLCVYLLVLACICMYKQYMHIHTHTYMRQSRSGGVFGGLWQTQYVSGSNTTSPIGWDAA